MVFRYLFRLPLSLTGLSSLSFSSPLLIAPRFKFGSFPRLRAYGTTSGIGIRNLPKSDVVRFAFWKGNSVRDNRFRRWRLELALQPFRYLQRMLVLRRVRLEKAFWVHSIWGIGVIGSAICLRGIFGNLLSFCCFGCSFRRSFCSTADGFFGHNGAVFQSCDRASFASPHLRISFRSICAAVFSLGFGGYCQCPGLPEKRASSSQASIGY